jgi:hypothetical protein
MSVNRRAAALVAIAALAAASLIPAAAQVVVYPPGGTVGTLTATLSDKGGQVYNVRAYGATGDSLYAVNGAVTSGTAALTAAGFVSADVGRTVVVQGAGAAGGPLTTTVSAVASSTSVTMAANAATTVTNAIVTITRTDDTAAFAAAIAAPFASAGAGGPVLVPPGNYGVELVNLNLTGTRLIGQSAARLVKKNPSGNQTIIQVSSPDCVVEGVTLVGTGVTNTQCVLIGTLAERAVVRNCRFVQAHGYGVRFSGPGGPSDVRVTDNLFWGSGYGVSTVGTNTSARVTIAGNTFDGNNDPNAWDGVGIDTPGATPFTAYGMSRLVISGNLVRGYNAGQANANHGIAVSNVQGASITGNTVVECSNDLIHLEDGADEVSIAGNHCGDGQRCGINIVSTNLNGQRNCESVSVTGNTVLRCCKGVDDVGGIAVATTASPTWNQNIAVVGNTVGECGGAGRASAWGIDLQFNVRNITVVGNTVRNTNATLAAGVRVGTGNDLTVARNRCYDDQGTKTQLYGIYFTGTQTRVRYYGNALENNATADLYTTGATFTNCWGPDTYGPSLTQQHALPAVSSDTFALLAAAQTLTNKTLTHPAITSEAAPAAAAGQVFYDSTRRAFGYGVGSTPTNLFGSLVCAVSTTPVTVSAAVLTDQNLMSYAAPAGLLNSANRTLKIRARGVLSTQATPPSGATFKVILGGVTVVTFQTGALAASQANTAWQFDAMLSTASTGASGTVEPAGVMYFRLAVGTGAQTVYVDNTFAAAGPIDLTAALTVQVTGAFNSNASTGNVLTQRQMIVELLP